MISKKHLTYVNYMKAIAINTYAKLIHPYYTNVFGLCFNCHTRLFVDVVYFDNLQPHNQNQLLDNQQQDQNN